MVDWAVKNGESGELIGARYWAEWNADCALYEVCGTYSVRDWRRPTCPLIAGPFNTFEAAYAAYEVIKGG